MKLSLRGYVVAGCLVGCAAAAVAAPRVPTAPGARQLRAQANLPVLAAALEATRTQLVGLMASGDVRTTYTTFEANLTKSPRPRFEAKTSQPKTARLLWQLAIMPYPAQSGQGWQSPPGLVDSGVLPDAIVPDGKQTCAFGLDLGYYLDVVRLNQPMKSQGLYPLQPRAAGPASVFGGANANSSLKQAHFGWARPGTGKITGAFVPKKTEKVITFYIRVVPLNAKGERVGNPSGMVAIRHNALPSDFTFATTTPAVHPTVTPVHWQPERHQDPNANYWRLIVRRPPLFMSLPGVPQAVFTAVAPGQKYPTPIEVYWPPQDKSWWDKVCAAVGDFISWVGDVVNYVSNLYSSLKMLVIDGLSMVAPELRGVFSMALDIGLMAVGLPPSLPDFDDLQNMGLDYLCSYVADETGIPAEVTKEALQRISEGTRDARHGGGDGNMWMVPDYQKLYRPACLEVRVTNTAAKMSDRVTVFCSVLANTAQGQRLVAAGNPLPLPELKPNETLTVPLYILGAPEYTEQVRLYLTTQMRYELNDKGLPINGKSNPNAEQYNRMIRAKQEWGAAQLQQAPAP